MTDVWDDAQTEEAAWWGDCANTYQEETKQRELVAPRLGLVPEDGAGPLANGHWPVYNLDGESVIDVGCGPVSLLLKCVNRGHGSAVLDPCPFPAWVWSRYRAVGLRAIRKPAEFIHGGDGRWDTAWIYNVLQHVQDPARVLQIARAVTGRVRVVEWVGVEEDDLHPHRLTADVLDEWLDTDGAVTWIDTAGAHLYHADTGR